MRTRGIFCMLAAVIAAACTGAQMVTATPSTETKTMTVSVNNGYPYGYATYYVATRRPVLPTWGMAKMWYAQAQAAGYSVGSTPQKGAIAWSGAGAHGHVAYVEGVSADSTQVKVEISEMYGPGGGWGKVTYRTVPAGAFKYIY